MYHGTLATLGNLLPLTLFARLDINLYFRRNECFRFCFCCTRDRFSFCLHCLNSYADSLLARVLVTLIAMVSVAACKNSYCFPMLFA